LKRQIDTTWTTRIEAARATDPLLVLHGYCRGDGCPVRLVRVTVKDYDRDVLPLVQRHGVRCPVCGHPLTCHGVLTAAAQAVTNDREARCNVNVQRYERDHGPFIPFEVMDDDRLP